MVATTAVLLAFGSVLKLHFWDTTWRFACARKVLDFCNVDS